MVAMSAADTISPSQVKQPGQLARLHIWQILLEWLATWELYPIIGAALFLRLYHFTATEFDTDQAVIFGMARGAVMHGLIPLTANASSIVTMNPPATIYLLMLGAIFSSSPYSGLLVVGILNVLAAVLTYIVTRRYYGRIAGTMAALLFTVDQLIVLYSRLIWNQSLLAPFVPLFIFALLWGVIERRQGWLAPAVVLWGLMIQLHGSAVLLAIPLAVACVLAFKTLRWRDIFLATGLLALVYVPFLIWEPATHFSDISILLNNIHSKSSIDGQALHTYLDFLSPYPPVPGNLLPWQSVLFWGLRWGGRGTDVLALCAFVFALCAACLSGWDLLRFAPRGAKWQTRPDEFSATPWGQLQRWWIDLLSTPWRCGLLVLLAWQIGPVIILSRHSLLLYHYYLLVLMPGPFMLIGIIFAQVIAWLRQTRFPWSRARYLIYSLMVALVLVQFAGSFTRTLDETDGAYAHSFAYNTLQDLQNALNEADQLARTHHFHHVYIDTDQYTHAALAYLSGQMQTPHTVLSGSHCLLLPDPAQGPALMLLGPADTFDTALLTHFASTMLVSEPPRLGGAPFHLYIVQPLTTTPEAASFVNALTLDRGRPASFSWHDPAQQTASTEHFLATSWTNLAQLPAAYGTTYTYHLRATYAGNGTDGQTGAADCAFTSITPGEQLLAAFPLPSGAAALPASLSITGSTWMDQPYEKSFGPFHFLSVETQTSLLETLRSSNGTGQIVVRNE